MLDVAAREHDGVENARRRDDGGAMLIVMEDRDIHQLAQALLDDEALGGLDVLEVDAAEAGAQIAHRIDELVGILGVDLKVDGVDVGEALEEHRLALHHGLGGERAQITKAQNGRAIGDDRHQIALDGVVIGAGGVFGDGEHGNGDSRRIGQRQVTLGRHGLGGHDLDLAGSAARMKLQRLLIGDGRALGAFGGLIDHSVSSDLAGRIGIA